MRYLPRQDNHENASLYRYRIISIAFYSILVIFDQNTDPRSKTLNNCALNTRSPIGKYFVQVCGTTPCKLRGSDDVMKACEENLGVHPGGT